MTETKEDIVQETLLEAKDAQEVAEDVLEEEIRQSVNSY